MSGLTIKEFDHKLKGGNFYSKGLCAWLKKHPSENRIVRALWNSFDGYNPERPILMIGHLSQSGHGFHGNRLHSVCRERGERTSFYFCGANFHIGEWVDVTDEFIEKYRSIGRCAIHGENDHDFERDEKSKTCKRCGAVYKKRVELVEKEIWEKAV